MMTGQLELAHERFNKSAQFMESELEEKYFIGSVLGGKQGSLLGQKDVVYLVDAECNFLLACRLF